MKAMVEVVLVHRWTQNLSVRGQEKIGGCLEGDVHLGKMAIGRTGSVERRH